MYCPNCGNRNEVESKFCSQCGNALPLVAAAHTGSSPPTNPTPPQKDESVVIFAGFWKRLVAMLLDGIILIAVSIFLLSNSTDEFTALWTFIAFFILPWLYFACMESSVKQATLGKMAIRIKVVDNLGNTISFGRASGRHFAKNLSALPFFIGYLMAAFTKRKQALHDIISKCLVVNQTSSQEQISISSTNIQQSIIVPFLIIGGLLIAIMLPAIAIPQFNAYRIKSYNALALSDLKNIDTGLKAYYAQNSYYPAELNEILDKSDDAVDNAYNVNVQGEIQANYLPMSFDNSPACKRYGNCYTTDYLLFVVHKKGTIVYSSSNNISTIYWKEKGDNLENVNSLDGFKPFL